MLQNLRVWFYHFGLAIFAVLNRWTGYPYQRLKFYKRHGYMLHLARPRSFSEKVIWKKTHDRNPLLPVVADKLRVREYLATVLGEIRAQELLIPLLYATTEPRTIPFADLPDAYILKTTHSSGWNIIVDAEHPADPARIIAECEGWLRQRYAVFKNEWAYDKITPRIIIEELLSDPSGGIPHDHKFFVFHGRCELIQVDFNRQSNHARNMYDRDWQLLDFVRYRVRQGPDLPRPANLEKMRDLAEELGRDFDYVRVDLYSVGERIYFGELTHYPGSGMTRIQPRQFDFDLGKHWQIQPGYWNTQTVDTPDAGSSATKARTQA
ncbi:MAG: ATP-grasp fold amidoligase family protein [Litorilinea sp.]